MIMLMVFNGGQSWFTWLPCSYATEAGICACHDDDEQWKEQLALRVAMSTAFVFAVMLVFSLAGCGAEMQRKQYVGKFLTVPGFFMLSLLFPNSAINKFRSYCEFMSLP